MNYFVVIDIT